MKLVRDARTLKTKALCSLRTGMQAFNSFDDDGRITTVLLHLQHACEMLLKAVLVQNQAKVFDKEAGRSISFDKCLGLCTSQFGLTAEEAGAMRAIDSLRDAAQHWFVVVAEDLLYLNTRALITAFDAYLKKGNQYYFGMKAHIGADAESGLVHHVHGTAANVADVTEVAQLLHGAENVVCADAGYTGVEKRPEHEGRPVIWQIAARRSTYKHLSKRSVLYKARRKIEKVKAQARAKVEHPFRVIKRQFGYVKTRFRGLAKNTAQLTTLFALSNLWMVRRQLLTATGEVRP